MIFAILPPRQKLKQDDELFYPGRHLRRAYLLAALAIAAIWALVSGCSFTLSTVTTSANMGRAFEDPFSRGKTNWGASVTGQFTRDR